MTSELIAYSSNCDSSVKRSHSRRLYGKSMDKSYHNNKNNNENNENNDNFNGTENDDSNNNNNNNNNTMILNENNNNNDNNNNNNDNFLLNDGLNGLVGNRIAKRRKTKKKSARYSLIRGWCGLKDLDLSSSQPLHFSASTLSGANRRIKRMNDRGQQKMRMRKRPIFKKISLKPPLRGKLISHSKNNNNNDAKKKRKALFSQYCCCRDITFNQFAFYYTPLSFTLFSFSPPQKQIFPLLQNHQSHILSYYFNQFHCSALVA